MSAPTITSITPNAGPGTGATFVTILGTNFVAPSTVTFGGKAAIDVTVKSATEITCLTPSDSIGAVTVTVSNANGSASSTPTSTSLLQSVEGGDFDYNDGTLNSKSQSTGPVNFASATQAGSLLVCVGIAEAFGPNPTDTAVPTIAPNTPGFSWTLAGSAFFDGASGSSNAQIVSIWYIANATSMATSVQTTVTVSDYAVGITGGLALFEFSGIAQSAPVDTVATADDGGNAVPQTSPIETTGVDMILCAATLFEYSGSSAGSGYTSGPSTDQGITQFKLNQAPGSLISTAFGAVYSNFAEVAVAFKATPNGFDYTSSNGTATQFTPIFPPIKKQPLGNWGLEATRHDSLTSSGLKSSVTERVDSVTTLIFNYVALSDMAAWKGLHAYSLTGGVFTYRPLLDYPNFTSTDPMFQYPGTDNGDDAAGYAVCQMVSMDFVPKFESPGAFSLSMKLRLIADVPANFVEAVGS